MYAVPQLVGLVEPEPRYRNMDTLTLTCPDDWHLHLRDGDMLAAVLPDTARRFARAIVMPNLKPPVRTVAEAAAYSQHSHPEWMSSR